MKIKAIVATTHIDLHNMRMTKEALESAAISINGPRKVKMGIEHDETIPPLGKVLEAWVEPTDDGEYRLVQSSEIFEQFEEAVLPDGTVLLKQEGEINQQPFVIGERVDTKGFALLYDRINFGTEDNRRAFLNEVKESSEVYFEDGEFFRKSVIPDPEIVIHLSELLVQYLIAKKVLEQAGDQVIELALQEVSRFYSFARSVIMTVFKYALPKNRPITHVFELPGTPFVQFVACTTDADLILSAIVEDKLESALAQVDQLQTLLHAEKIQFLLNAEGQWEFNYLLTDTGGVVGTEKSFSRRTRRLQLLSSRSEDSSSDPAQEEDLINQTEDA